MIRFARKEDLPAIEALWEICFPDDTGFNAYFFENIFALDTTLVYEMDHQIVSMLQMLPYYLSIQGKTEPVTYIYGACTHPQFRRNHLMAQLLEYTFVLDCAQHRAASCLIPQETWLFDFYRAFGYQPICSVQEKRMQVDMIPHAGVRRLCKADIPRLVQIYQHTAAHYDSFICRTIAQWETQIALFEALGAGAFGQEIQGVLQAYAFVWKQEDALWVQECAGETQALLQAIAAAQQIQTIRITQGGTEQPLGCIKFYKQEYTAKNGYMNLMLN